jgi:hypothetical protein
MFGAFSLGYWLWLAPGLLLAAYASYRVRSAYAENAARANRSGLRGVDVVVLLARSLGLRIRVEESPGHLSDHYEPGAKVVRLSPEVFHGRSVSSLAIAAHEVGHALQDHEGNALLRARSALAPIASLGSNLSWILILLGLVLHFTGLAWLGVFAFGAAVLFHVVTLPVELDASAKAARVLDKLGIVTSSDERAAVQSVLSAAALTYVAGALTALLQLGYFASQVLGASRDER